MPFDKKGKWEGEYGMGLTSRKRQKNQLELAFTEEPKSEAPRTDGRAELRVADQEPESGGTVERLMEEICEPENLRKALGHCRMPTSTLWGFRG